MDIVASLKRAEIFLGLNDSDLRKIAELPSCREEAYQEGEVVFRADDEAKEIYVLTDGQIDLVTEVPQAEQENTRVVVDRITTGDFFGWSSLVDPHSRVMEAICQKPSRVVIISGAELMALFEEDNRIGYILRLAHAL